MVRDLSTSAGEEFMKKIQEARSFGFDEELGGQDESLREKEDVNRPLPHLRVSGENWSDRFVGRTQGPQSATGSQPPGRV